PPSPTPSTSPVNPPPPSRAASTPPVSPSVSRSSAAGTTTPPSSAPPPPSKQSPHGATGGPPNRTAGRRPDNRRSRRDAACPPTSHAIERSPRWTSFFGISVFILRSVRSLRSFRRTGGRELLVCEIPPVADEEQVDDGLVERWEPRETRLVHEQIPDRDGVTEHDDHREVEHLDLTEIDFRLICLPIASYQIAPRRLCRVVLRRLFVVVHLELDESGPNPGSNRDTKERPNLL